MRHFFLLLLAIVCAQVCRAQTVGEVADTVRLGEVVVDGARIVNRTDGKVMYPSDRLKAACTSAYSLLKRLPVANLKVDDVQNTISLTSVLGTAEVRINDVKATQSDLLSLDIEAVESVEYITSPGARYGQDVGMVINIHIRRAVSGYVAGANVQTGLTSPLFRYGAYGRFNHGRSEFSADYSGYYKYNNGMRTSEEGSYLMADGTTTRVLRTDLNNRTRTYNHDIQLRHTLAEPERYVLQTTLGLGYDRTPMRYSLQDVQRDTHSYRIENSGSDRTLTPTLDIYALLHVGSRQTVTANVTGTYVRPKSSSAMTTDGTPYSYTVKGRTASFYGEAVYENRLKPFTFSSGAQYFQRYTNNLYSGDASALSVMHRSEAYLWAQIKGSVLGTGYLLSAGLDRIYFRSGQSSSTNLTFRPKLTLSRSIATGLKARYDFSYGPYISRMQEISDVAVKTNDMELTAGNPTLEPCTRTEHVLTLSYDKGPLYSELTGFYRGNSDCVMQRIYRNADGMFVYTRANQKACNMFYIQNFTRYEIIPDRLSAYLSPTLYRMYNYGDDYKHHYTSFSISGHVQATFGKLSVDIDADNGFRFLEGETKNENLGSTTLTVSYKAGNVTLMGYWMYWFDPSPKTNKAEILNRLVHKTVTLRSSDYGNMVGVKVSWNLSKGRKYTDIRRNGRRKDTDTGIVGK